MGPICTIDSFVLITAGLVDYYPDTVEMSKSSSFALEAENGLPFRGRRLLWTVP